MVSRFVPIALAFALVASAGFATGVSDSASAGSAPAEDKEMIRNAWVSYRRSPGMAAQSTMYTGYQR